MSAPTQDQRERERESLCALRWDEANRESRKGRHTNTRRVLSFSRSRSLLNNARARRVSLVRQVVSSCSSSGRISPTRTCPRRRVRNASLSRERSRERSPLSSVATVSRFWGRDRDAWWKKPPRPRVAFESSRARELESSRKRSLLTASRHQYTPSLSHQNERVRHIYIFTYCR